ncbi:MAG: hypothetical protein RL033_1298 [Pseudomonadota bacterium]|jgi:hypothetical protein
MSKPENETNATELNAADLSNVQGGSFWGGTPPVPWVAKLRKTIKSHAIADAAKALVKQLNL